MIMTGQSFLKARLKLGLTQRQLAPLLGYGRQTVVSAIERNQQIVTPQSALLMQAYLDGYRPSFGWPEKPGPKRPGRPKRT